MRSTRAFTLMEVLVVISIIALLLAILIPGLSLARQTVNKMKSKTQLRAIQNSFVAYADKNNDWYPGLTSDGENGYYDYIVNDRSTNDGVRVQPDGPDAYGPGAVTALWLLIREVFLVPEDLVSPVDVDTQAFRPGDLDVDGLYSVGTVSPSGVHDDNWSSGNYSYATLSIADPTGAGDKLRRRLWRNNGNAQLPVAGDRAIDHDLDNGGEDEIRSVHTNPAPGDSDWSGLIVWNDGHVTQGTDSAEISTRLTDETPTSGDYLFGAPGGTLLQHNNVDGGEY